MWHRINFILFCGLLGSPFVLGQTRMIAHVTRDGGGFESTIILENQDVASKEFTLTPYNREGAELEPVRGSLGNMEMASFTVAELFPGRADLSHFLIEGEVRATIAYRASNGRGSPAHVGETQTRSARYRLFNGDWSRVFDGIAVVNTGNESTEVRVTRHHLDRRAPETVNAMTLPPFAKDVFVIGGPGVGAFEPVDDTWFEVHADQPLAITALRGSLPGSQYLWASEAAVYRPAVVKVTNDNPGTSACIDPTTLPKNAPDVNNMPQGEVWIDVSDDGRLVSCAKDYRYSSVDNTTYNDRVWGGIYFSEDGGNTWKNEMFLDSDPNTGISGRTNFGEGAGSAIHLDHLSDPVVAFDRDGNIYSCGLAFTSDHDPNTSTLSEPSTLTVVRRDRDGSVVPGTTHLIALENDEKLFNDKNWIAVDRSSPVESTVVAITWRLFVSDTDASRAPGGYLAVSADGAATFGNPIRLPIDWQLMGAVQFFQPLIGPDPVTGRKTLYIIYRESHEDFSMEMHLFKADIDGLASGTEALHQHLSQPNTWSWLSRRLGDLFSYGSSGYGGSFRFNSFFFPAIDPETGDLYVAFHAFDLDSQGSSVRISHSGDAGVTWSDPIKVDYPGFGFQFMPSVAVRNGVVSMLWYDTRHDSSFAPFTLIRGFDMYYAELDSSLTLLRVLRLTPETQQADHPVFTRRLPDTARKALTGPHEMNPGLRMGMTLFPLIGAALRAKADVADCDGYGFIGDYIGLAADSDYAYAVWADLRDLDTTEDICAGHSCNGRRNQNVYFARIRKEQPVAGVGIAAKKPGSTPLGQNYRQQIVDP